MLPLVLRYELDSHTGLPRLLVLAGRLSRVEQQVVAQKLLRGYASLVNADRARVRLETSPGTRRVFQVHVWWDVCPRCPPLELREWIKETPAGRAARELEEKAGRILLAPEPLERRPAREA